MERAELRRRWYRYLERVPAAYCAWQRSHRGRHVVDASTDLVIEGYSGVGNTYARTVFQKANPRARIASHLHSTAHIERALQLGVPVLVLLRAPVDAVVSTLARFPDKGRTVDDELGRYEHLYRGALGVADRVAFAGFEDTTNRPDVVVDAVNWKFGTNLAAFATDDVEAQQVVQSTIDGWADVVFGSDGHRNRALPSHDRRVESGPLREQLHDRRHTAARRRCEVLHDDLTAIARARIAAVGGC